MKTLTFAVACAALLVPLQAVAEPLTEDPATGSRIASRVDRKKVESEKESALVGHEYAKCLVARQERDVHAFLSTDEKAGEKAADRLSAQADCVSLRASSHLVEGYMVTYPPDVLRGMLAEHLVKKSIAEARQLPPLALQRAYERPWFATTGRSPVVDEMAACIADTNPAGVVALVASDPYGRDEIQAYGALKPNMVSCLRAGATLEANRQALRAALAEALYQRLQAPPPVTAATQPAK
jgi:hypothetical protein